MLQHIQMLDSQNVFREYEGVITAIQAGFIGAWGKHLIQNFRHDIITVLSQIRRYKGIIKDGFFYSVSMHTQEHSKHYYTYIMMYLFYFSTGEWHYTNSDFGIPGPCQSGTLGLSQSQWDARHSVLQALLNAAPQSMYVCLLSLCV